jgi:hypothetical protein
MRRQVELTLEELGHWGKDVEKKLVERMRRHGIPVKGFLHFQGVKTGVLRARSLGDRRVFEWWDTVENAARDGVYFGEQARMHYVAFGGRLS